MTLSYVNSIARGFTTRRPKLLHAVAWTAFLALTVAVASLSPQIAFLYTISPSSSFSMACDAFGTVRIPLDVPGEVLCLPAHRFRRSKMEFLVRPIFAALVVAGSLWVVGSMDLWDTIENRG